MQNVVTYTVVFEVENDERHTLIPGLSVNVEIECVSKPAVPQISNVALRFKPPIPLEEQRAMKEEAVWLSKPTVDMNGEKAAYCSKAYAWRYLDERQEWIVVPLWVGVTDNISTEILAGAGPGDTFARKFIDKTESGFSFKDALKLADPGNRSL